MLSERKATILGTIVREYVQTAAPVGSEHLARTYGLGVSPATIRNEMADLEGHGYITHPHTSAGRVPADKGYRYYVESLMVETALTPEEQFTIRHQFHQVERDFEEWSRLAAAILAQAVHNAAVVTPPQGSETRLKRVDLVWLQEFVALLIAVFQNASLRRQILSFKEPVSQERLDAVAQYLSATLAGKTAGELAASAVASDEDPVVAAAFEAANRILHAADEQRYHDVYLDGLRHVFRQPEFASSMRMRQILDVLEERRLLADVLPRLSDSDGVQVVIGQENRDDAMRECSVVLTRYRAPGQTSGILGVIGPTRMAYDRTIPIVRYMGQVMTDLARELDPSPS